MCLTSWNQFYTVFLVYHVKTLSLQPPDTLKSSEMFLVLLWCSNYPSSLPLLLTLFNIFCACGQTINRTVANLQTRIIYFVQSFSNCNIGCTHLSLKRRYIGAEVMHEQKLLEKTAQKQMPCGEVVVQWKTLLNQSLLHFCQFLISTLLLDCNFIMLNGHTLIL